MSQVQVSGAPIWRTCQILVSCRCLSTSALTLPQTCACNIAIPDPTRSVYNRQRRRRRDTTNSYQQELFPLLPGPPILDAPRARAGKVRRTSRVSEVPHQCRQVRLARHAVQLCDMGYSRHQPLQRTNRRGEEVYGEYSSSSRCNRCPCTRWRSSKAESVGHGSPACRSNTWLACGSSKLTRHLHTDAETRQCSRIVCSSSVETMFSPDVHSVTHHRKHAAWSRKSLS
jgi:hypothetical protein